MMLDEMATAEFSQDNCFLIMTGYILDGSQFNSPRVSARVVVMSTVCYRLAAGERGIGMLPLHCLFTSCRL